MPAIEPSASPRPARQSVMNRLSLISRPARRSYIAVPTRAGDGRNAGSIRAKLLAACQSKPSTISGMIRPAGDQSKESRSDGCIGLLRRERLTPDRNPDLVAHLVEGVRCEELFARDIAVEIDVEFL